MIAASYPPLRAAAIIIPTMLLYAIMACSVGQTAPPALPLTAKLEPRHRELLERSCFACHGCDRQEAGVRLDDLPLEIETVAAAERWQKVLNVINAGEMPPPDEPQPDRQAKLEFLADLSHQMVVSRKALADQGGRITMRRLSRREYANTIRDLLGVEPDLTYLPEDGRSGTFDTVGVNLFMSADQVEQYLAAGRKAIDDHFALLKKDPDWPVSAEEDRPVRRTIRIEPESLARHGPAGMLKFEKWIAALEAEVEKPEHDDTLLARAFRERIAAREAPNADLNARFGEIMRLAAAWEEAGFGPKAADFGFKDVPDASRAYQSSYRRNLRVSHLPRAEAGMYLQLASPLARAMPVPAEQKGRPGNPAAYSLGPGRHLLRVRVGALPDAHRCRRFIEVQCRSRESPSHPEIAAIVSTHHVVGTVENPEIVEIPLRIQPGTDPALLSFSVAEKQHESAPRFKVREGGDHPVLWIDWVEIEGPLPEEHLPEVVSPAVVSRPQTASARKVIESFATRAFRGRPVDAKLLARLVALHAKRRALGEPFEIAIRRPLAVVLAAPDFLYLAELGDEGSSRPLTDVELANRLSYFLWSGPPDDELLTAARRGTLRDAATLESQVTRMLADKRLMRSVEGFAFQWLHLDRLDLFQYPGSRHLFYDRTTREASRREIYETYADILRHGRPLSELLKCDSVVVNGLLAAYYGIDGVDGDEWRRVSLPPDSPRGGFLGMAAIMAMGSNGTISSPVERGAWVLRTILHDPPPPAPPNVPQISNAAMLKQRPRERIMIHQQEPQCAACHRKIDPIGFGLENFDAAGRWRDADSLNPLDPRVPTFSIDSSGRIHGGPAFDDYFGLRDALAARTDDFARGHAEALIQFALGRPVGFSDEELVARIVAQAREHDYRADAFLRGLVSSPEFRTK